MSNILNGITEAKRSPEPDYDDPSWDEKVQNIGQKAKQAELLKSKGKEPRTRWNPETKKYYVDFSDQVDEGYSEVPMAPSIGVKQINKLITTLRKRDLLSVSKNIDAALAKKTTKVATESSGLARVNNCVPIKESAILKGLRG